MAEDQEIKEKPKTTLIKHKKTQPVSKDNIKKNDEEKKKVVVVKKKVVVVKKTGKKDTAEDNAKQKPSASKNNQTTETVPEKQSTAEKINTITGSPSDKRPSPENRIKQDGDKKYSQPRSNQRTGYSQDRGYNSQSQRPGGYQQDGSQRTGGYQGQRQGGYQQDGSQRTGGYQGQRQGGYQQDGSQRTGGYQGQRQGGYQQDGSQRTGGYQGQRQGGYQQDGSQRTGGYQGQRPGGYQQDGSQRTGGYQGQRPGGYQQGQRPGGYQQGQRPGGYQQGQRPGGYQQGQRPGGYQQGQRPGGYQQDGSQRTGGYQGQSGDRKPFNNRFQPGDRQQRPSQGASGGSTPMKPDASKSSTKKFFKAKKKTSYQKNKKDDLIEKNFHIKKKSIQKINPVPKEIDIMEVITVSELAKKMNLKASELIGKLMGLGMMVTINQQIDAETAEIVASEFGCKVNIVSLFEETIVECDKGSDEDIIERPPIVTVMGHVDHGKTKLLDAIKSTDIASSEHGGITQHIGAYKVNVNGKSIVFLDTPGHEAFTLMRARGAQITDIVVLVVAANDGVMPQTIEAINHAKEAKVPIIVAINKIDIPDANPDRVKQQLSEYNLIPEAWGGSTIFAEISALKKTGIDDLLENILIQSEILELTANPNCRAEGKVIESKVDHGRGIVSSVLIQRGTLKVGDAFIAGIYPGKVRAMFNDHGEKVDEAPPATPVEILGFTGMPNAGDPFQVTENEKYARQIGEKRQELEKIGVAKNVKKVTLDNLYDSIQDGEIQELKAIVKGDVQGSVEALKIALEKLSTSEIRLNVIHASAGAIIENDVNLASASNAIIVGFHVRPTPKAQMLAEQEKVEIKKYNIIYDAVEDIKTSLEGMLAPELKEETIGTVEVRETFKVPKIGTIAGCYVTGGKVKRGGIAHLYRDGIDIFSGKISSLKRFKDDAKEVDKGYECGIGLENYTDIQAGDIIEIIEIKEISKKLDG